MDKLRIIITSVYEYVPNKSNYPNAKTLDEMLAMDLETAGDFPHLFIGDKSKFTIKGEVVK